MGAYADVAGATCFLLVAVEIGSMICYGLVCDLEVDLVVAVLVACAELPASQATEGEHTNNFGMAVKILFAMAEPAHRLLLVLQLPGSAAAFASLSVHQDCFRYSFSYWYVRHALCYQRMLGCAAMSNGISRQQTGADRLLCLNTLP